MSPVAVIDIIDATSGPANAAKTAHLKSLGVRYLRKTLDRFGGVTEYALAAYNAGGERVLDWQTAGPYRGIDKFVESIPFTETREYVEAILRNYETYKAIDQFAGPQGRAGSGTSR